MQQAQFAEICTEEGWELVEGILEFFFDLLIVFTVDWIHFKILVLALTFNTLHQKDTSLSAGTQRIGNLRSAVPPACDAASAGQQKHWQSGTPL